MYYVGDSDWLAWVEDGSNITREIYLHANGRPLRVGLRYINQFPPWYHRYNGRGDATFVPQDGNGGAGWRSYGAWGDLNYASDNRGYYNWNGAWGYMSFPLKFNFDMNDALDMGLYYAHGRWYNQDTGLWLSPNEKGDYLYGGDGQDPVNIGMVDDGFCDWIWIPFLCPPQTPTPTPTPIPPSPSPTIPPSPRPPTPSRTWTPVRVLTATRLITPSSTPLTPICAPPSDNYHCINPSVDNLQTMVAHVLYEEGGSIMGDPIMRNISQVIRNRIGDRQFAPDILGVISQGNGTHFNGWRV
ncbi:MAG: hypothetical protein P0119_22730, partial [Nitrospira sp.]|nr:hypothetical protein [Nitrospira sp.]